MDWVIPLSPREEIEGLVYFPRLVEKIRLHQNGKLHPDYVVKLGAGFDEACCKFLGIDYQELRAQIEGGATTTAAFAWALEAGNGRTEEDRKLWSTFLTKRGWRDEVSEILAERRIDLGMEGRDEVQTFFDFIDADEGRL